MKVFFDIIYTQAPSRCSTTVQFVTLAERLLADPDVYIYWPRLKNIPEEELSFFPVSDRIQYFETDQTEDRLREYSRIPKDIENLISFWGDVWDWDVMVTVRTPQVPMMKIQALSPRHNSRYSWTKRVVVIEDMMVLSKKPTVAQNDRSIQDRQTIEGYLAADAVFIPAYHEKKWVMQVAKDHYSISRLRDLQAKLKEVCHLEMPEYLLKTEHKYDGKRKLNLAFVGRLERANARLEVINKILTDQYILHSAKVHSFICTVTKGTSFVLDKHSIEMRHPKREEFWKICKEEMDLAVYFHMDAELLMGVLEPICFGVPAIIVDAPWSHGMLGEDYPFYVKTSLQAHALVTAFRENYDEMYAKFAKWQQEWFVPVYNQRKQEDNLYDHVVAAVLNPPEQPKSSLGQNSIVQAIAQLGGDELVIQEVIATSKEHFGVLIAKLEENFKFTHDIMWQTPWNDFRQGLIALGYEDASIKVGHMRKRQDAQP